MPRLIAILALFCAFTLSSMSSAEARWFEPQANWRHAGALCVASRHPPGRRWRRMPPRTCRVDDDRAADMVEAQNIEFDVVKPIGDLNLAGNPDQADEAAPLAPILLPWTGKRRTAPSVSGSIAV